VGSIHFDTRTKVEASEASDFADAGKYLGVGSLVVQMSWVPRPMDEAAGS
jgi:hypothetical protein